MSHAIDIFVVSKKLSERSYMKKHFVFKTLKFLPLIWFLTYLNLNYFMVIYWYTDFLSSTLCMHVIYQLVSYTLLLSWLATRKLISLMWILTSFIGSSTRRSSFLAVFLKGKFESFYKVIFQWLFKFNIVPKQ